LQIKSARPRHFSFPFSIKNITSFDTSRGTLLTSFPFAKKKHFADKIKRLLLAVFPVCDYFAGD
jgi:hypothetical protein